MKLQEIHPFDRDLSVVPFFKGTVGTTTALQLQPTGVLKEHFSKTPAVLLCVSGEAHYEDENGTDLILRTGDYVAIDPVVKHWVKANELTQLLLFK